MKRLSTRSAQSLSFFRSVVSEAHCLQQTQRGWLQPRLNSNPKHVNVYDNVFSNSCLNLRLLPSKLRTEAWMKKSPQQYTFITKSICQNCSHLLHQKHQLSSSTCYDTWSEQHSCECCLPFFPRAIIIILAWLSLPNVTSPWCVCFLCGSPNTSHLPHSLNLRIKQAVSKCFRILRLCNVLTICRISWYLKDIDQPRGFLICEDVFSPDCSIPFLFYFLCTWKMESHICIHMCVDTCHWILCLGKKCVYH